jgi:hypothetical protein
LDHSLIHATAEKDNEAVDYQQLQQMLRVHDESKKAGTQSPLSSSPTSSKPSSKTAKSPSDHKQPKGKRRSVDFKIWATKKEKGDDNATTNNNNTAANNVKSEDKGSESDTPSVSRCACFSRTIFSVLISLLRDAKEAEKALSFEAIAKADAIKEQLGKKYSNFATLRRYVTCVLCSVMSAVQ